MIQLRPDYQQRVLEENQQLEDRIKKLTYYLSTQQFQLLDERDQQLLSDQLDAMLEYQSILIARIVRFG